MKPACSEVERAGFFRESNCADRLSMLTARQTYQMLDNETLWQTAQRVHELLDERGVPHAIAGGVAVALHGYRRNTVDVDVVIRRVDSETVKSALTEDGFAWIAERCKFVSDSGTQIQFLIAGERAGTGSVVKLPDPGADGVIEIAEGLPVLTLARLIESKIACGEGNLRRAHKDFADVVELAAIHRLDGTFARFLHRSVRKQFRELVRHSQSGG
jgi:hypothetical protein